MERTKVIKEPSDLVFILRAVDSEVKKNLLKDISQAWMTEKEIEEKYGKNGIDALRFFEKMKLVESRWSSQDNTSQKAYHTYYISFHINTSCTIREITDILSVAVMPEKEFKEIENTIIKIVGKSGCFAGDVAEHLDISPLMLKSIVKRSSKLEYRGHRIELFKE